jgi:uncharacterized protein YbbC (DUF1343 family)
MGKVIFKFWFKNGSYIEKEVAINESVSDEEKIKFVKASHEIQNCIKECFKDTDNHGQVTIEGMVIRVDDLIAFDMIPIDEKEETIQSPTDTE